MHTVDNQPRHSLSIAYGPIVRFAYKYMEIVSPVEGLAVIMKNSRVDREVSSVDGAARKLPWVFDVGDSRDTAELGGRHNIDNRVCSVYQRFGERLLR